MTARDKSMVSLPAKISFLFRVGISRSAMNEKWLPAGLSAKLE